MIIEKYLGKTLSALSEETHIFNKPIRVFLLTDSNDSAGKLLAEGFTVRQIILNHPSSRDMVVKMAENYYGETVLRIASV